MAFNAYNQCRNVAILRNRIQRGGCVWLLCDTSLVTSNVGNQRSCRRSVWRNSIPVC